MAKTEHTMTREYGLQNFVTPTGRQLGLQAYKVNPGLLEINYLDGKGGLLPAELSGLYTKRTVAEEALRTWLNKFWDTSDKAK